MPQLVFVFARNVIYIVGGNAVDIKVIHPPGVVVVSSTGFVGHEKTYNLQTIIWKSNRTLVDTFVVPLSFVAEAKKFSWIGIQIELFGITNLSGLINIDNTA